MPQASVQIAVISIDDTAAAATLDSLTLSPIPPYYRDRLASMQSDRARRQTRAGLWLLEQLLVDAGEPIERLTDLGFSGDGRPTLAAGPSFNISHSRGLVVCALSHELTVGIDVEVRNQRVPPRLAGATSRDERAAVRAVPSAFFDYWSAREATIKASGRVGLGRLKRVSLSPGFARVDGEHWHLRPLSLASDYAGCLATSAPVSSTAIRISYPTLTE